jgi:splicing factor 1
LEGKTGCKIAIRGRGSVKEGARGRRDGKVMDGDNEPLHVIVSGDNQKAVDAASDMVEQLLVVIDDEKNVHKQQQLRELALLNGTLKDDEFCEICAEKGHRAFACPKRFAMRKPVATIKCAICGDTSHPTSDCTQKPGTVENKELDSEYQSFMAELDGKKPAAAKLPPPPTNLPPPPANGGPPPPPANLPRPPPPANLPPPRPTNLPPPPAGGQRPPDHNYYGRHQQHQQPNGYGQQQQQGYGQQQQQQPPYPGHGQQQPNQQHQPNQQQQQGRQVRPGEETAGWDPSSYYGSYGGGTGGFNWWEK